MSWQTINNVLGLMIIDEVFANKLLKDPYEALNSYNIQFSPADMELFCTCQAQTLHELSQQLLEKLEKLYSDR